MHYNSAVVVVVGNFVVVDDVLRVPVDGVVVVVAEIDHVAVGVTVAAVEVHNSVFVVPDFD